LQDQGVEGRLRSGTQWDSSMLVRARQKIFRLSKATHSPRFPQDEVSHRLFQCSIVHTHQSTSQSPLLGAGLTALSSEPGARKPREILEAENPIPDLGRPMISAILKWNGLRNEQFACGFDTKETWNKKTLDERLSQGLIDLRNITGHVFDCKDVNGDHQQNQRQGVHVQKRNALQNPIFVPYGT